MHMLHARAMQGLVQCMAWLGDYAEPRAPLESCLLDPYCPGFQTAWVWYCNLTFAISWPADIIGSVTLLVVKGDERVGEVSHD